MDIGTRVKIVKRVHDKHNLVYLEGVVIYVGKRVLVQFDHCILGHNGNGIGRPDYCWMVNLENIKEEIQNEHTQKSTI